MHTPQNKPIFTQNTMKYFKSNAKNSGKYVAPRRRRRQEPEEWVRKEPKNQTFKPIDHSLQSFPSLTNTTPELKTETIKYDIKKIFENRRKKREKKTKIPEGYVRIYFKNGKPCKEYGPLRTPPINNDEYLYQKKIQELDLRQYQEDEQAELDGYKNEYLPYWIKETTEIDDFEEEYSDCDYSSESEYDDYLTDEDLDFYDMN